MKDAKAYVCLGANLGKPIDTFRAALDSLRANEAIELDQVSSVYRSSPVGFSDQPDFMNAVVRVTTTLTPINVLDELLELETRLGRLRGRIRFGPRVIDLDLLLYDQMSLDSTRLTIPHPRLHLRRFALQPLVEICPAIDIPGRGRAKDLLRDLLEDQVERVTEDWYRVPK